MSATSIEWTRTYHPDGSFTAGWSVNPIKARHRETGATGHYCERVSPACGNCYAARFQPRFGLPSFAGYKQRAERLAMLELYVDEKALQSVLRRRKPTRIFWEDMADLFGPWVPEEMIDRCFAVQALAPQHTHLVLTKHADQMQSYFSHPHRDTIIDWPKVQIWRERNGCGTGEWTRDYARLPIARLPLANVMLGVTVGNQEEADRWRPYMKQLAVNGWPTWVSYEPALGPVDWSGWHFVKMIIGGGESGPHARPSHGGWFQNLQRQCHASAVAFHFKQWGEWIHSSQLPYELSSPARGSLYYHNEPGAILQPEVSKIVFRSRK